VVFAHLPHQRILSELKYAEMKTITRSCSLKMKNKTKVYNYYSQIDLAMAALVGLKTHPSLIGRSIIGNGQQSMITSLKPEFPSLGLRFLL
jgi:hypothetical protein